MQCVKINRGKKAKKKGIAPGGIEPPSHPYEGEKFVSGPLLVVISTNL